jgi:hypothetical protein
MAGKLTKWSQNIPTSIARPSEIYSNWDFLFENMPSGNPGPNDANFRQTVTNPSQHFQTRNHTIHHRVEWPTKVVRKIKKLFEKLKTIFRKIKKKVVRKIF